MLRSKIQIKKIERLLISSQADSRFYQFTIGDRVTLKILPTIGDIDPYSPSRFLIAGWQRQLTR